LDNVLDFKGSGKLGACVLLSVTDTGVGIDEATKAKIFDPFFTTKEIGKGTGLGLSTVYGIVKQHKGHIEVLGEPGLGTTFNIYFPTVPKRVGAEERKPQPQIRAGRETILLAEDDEQVRRFLKEVLSRYGYKVIEAVDGEDAMEKFKCHNEIDLVILDTVMPKKNGKEAFDEIVRVAPYVKVLFMSGYTADVILEKGVQDKEIEFICKPISATDLLLKVGEILDTRLPI
jgi:CheY-like chemotaxis protein